MCSGKSHFWGFEALEDDLQKNSLYIKISKSFLTFFCFIEFLVDPMQMPQNPKNVIFRNTFYMFLGTFGQFSKNFIKDEKWQIYL